jgi:uncharacterized protein YeaO (DUF488 family)
MEIVLKRVYEDASPEDGYRVLVDRIWPRGISKEKLIEISRFVKERKFDSSDENLMQILGEIELRVEVELAKLIK